MGMVGGGSDAFIGAIHLVEISATFIRKSLREGKNVSAFVPQQVYDFIEENEIYRGIDEM